MKILMASDFYAPFIGGAERQVQLLSKELTRRGHEVKVVTLWQPGLPKEQDDEGITVYRFKGLSNLVPWFSSDANRRYHPPFPDPAISWQIRQLVKEWQPDLVHAHNWIGYSCAAALLGKNIPLLLSVRDYGFGCATRTLLRDGKVCDGPSLEKCLSCAMKTYGPAKGVVSVAGVQIGRLLLNQKISTAHCISTYVQMTVRRDLFEKNQPTTGRRSIKRLFCNRAKEAINIRDIVLPSVLTEVKNSKADLPDGLPDEPYILFVGALQKHKGVHTLVEAYAKLKNAPKLVMIGTTWPDTPREFPAGVTVLGNVPHAQVMKAWEKCTFAVSPTLWAEPLGGVILEAMSKSKAVIATNVGGPLDMIADGVNGYLVPPGDSEALAAAMQTLIDNPALREKFGQASLERVKLFRPETVLPEFEKLYLRLAKITKTTQPELPREVAVK